MSELQAQVAKQREKHLYAKPGFKGRASLFVTDSEAAGIDTEAVYEACVGGIATLSQYDARFKGYLGNLLHSSSVSYQRELKTEQENKILDTQLNGLLDHLSLFATEHETHIVLEYLIRRYRVNEYNCEHLLRCMISCHDTKIFARLVQHTTIANHWSFLSGVKTSGSPLPRSVIVSACKQNATVLSCLMDVVSTAVQFSLVDSVSSSSSSKVYAGVNRIISFFTAVASEVCEGSKLSDQHARDLVTFLIKGLALPTKEDLGLLLSDKDHVLHQLRRSCLMIIIQFSRTNRLSQQLVFSFVKGMIVCLNAMFGHVDSDDLANSDFGFITPFIMEILSSLVVMSQYQEVVFTRSLLKSAFIEHYKAADSSNNSCSPLLGALQLLQSKCDLSSILQSVCQGLFAEYEFGVQCIREKRKGISSSYCEPVEGLLSSMMSSGMIGSSILSEHTFKLLAYYSEIVKLTSDSDDDNAVVMSSQVKSNIISLLQTISQRFPNMFDNCIRKIISDPDHSGPIQEALGLIYSTTTSHRMPDMENNGFNLVLSLAHPSPHLRLDAIKKFDDLTFSSSDQHQMKDLQGLVDILLLSANDANADIRSVIWSESVLTKVSLAVNPDALLDLLSNSWNHWLRSPSLSDRISMTALILSSLSYRAVAQKLQDSPDAIAWVFKITASCIGGLFNNNSNKSSNSDSSNLLLIVKAAAHGLQTLSSSLPCLANIVSIPAPATKSKGKPSSTSENSTVDVQKVIDTIADNMISGSDNSNFYSLSELTRDALYSSNEKEEAWSFLCFINGVRSSVGKKLQSSSSSSSKLSKVSSSSGAVQEIPRRLAEVQEPLLLSLALELDVSVSTSDFYRSIIVSFIEDIPFLDRLLARSSTKVSDFDKIFSEILAPPQGNSLFYRLLLCLLQNNGLSDLVGLLLSKVPADCIPEVLLKVVLSENNENSISLSNSNLSEASNSLFIHSKAKANSLFALAAFLQAQLQSTAPKVSDLQCIHIVTSLVSSVLACSDSQSSDVRAAGLNLASKLMSFSGQISKLTVPIAKFKDAVAVADLLEICRILLSDSNAIVMDASVSFTVLTNNFAKIGAKQTQIYRSFSLLASVSGWEYLHVTLALCKPLVGLSLQSIWPFGLSALVNSKTDNSNRSSNGVYSLTGKNNFANFSSLISQITCSNFKGLPDDIKSDLIATWIYYIRSSSAAQQQQYSINFFMRSSVLQVFKSEPIFDFLTDASRQELFIALIDQQVQFPGDSLISDATSRLFVPIETVRELITAAIKEFKRELDSSTSSSSTSSVFSSSSSLSAAGGRDRDAMNVDSEHSNNDILFDDSSLYSKLSAPIRKLSSLLEGVAHCLMTASIGSDDQQQFASIAASLMDVFLLSTHQGVLLSSFAAVESLQVQLLDMFAGCLKVSSQFIINAEAGSSAVSLKSVKLTLASKKTNAAKPNEATSSISAVGASLPIYAAGRVVADTNKILAVIVAAKSPQLPAAGLSAIEGLIRLDPTALAPTIESLGQILSNATKLNLFSSNLLLEKTLTTMVSLTSEPSHKSNIFPQDITNSLLLFADTMPNQQRLNLIDIAINAVGVHTLPVVIQCLLIHVSNSYDTSKLSATAAAVATDSSAADGNSAAQPFILLSRAAQKKAFKSIKASTCEELFHLSVSYSASLPAILQVGNLIMQIKTAHKIFESAYLQLTCASSNGHGLVNHDIFNVDLARHVGYQSRLASMASTSSSSLSSSGTIGGGGNNMISLALLILEYITELLQHRAFHKMLALSRASNPTDASSSSSSSKASSSSSSSSADKSIQVAFLVFVEHLLELLSFASFLQQGSISADTKKVTFSVKLKSSSVTLSQSAMGRTLWSQIMIILEHLQRVLDGPTFIQILEELLNHTDPNVRQRALIILSQRLESMSTNQESSDYEIHLFLDLIVKLRESLKISLPSLLSNTVAVSTSNSLVSSEPPQLGLAQSSVLCIDSIARYLVNAKFKADKSDGNMAIGGKAAAGGGGGGVASSSSDQGWKDKVMMDTLKDLVDFSIALQRVTNVSVLAQAKALVAPSSGSTPGKSPSSKKSKSEADISSLATPSSSSSSSLPTTAASLASMTIASQLGLMKLLGSAFLCSGTLCGVVGPKSLLYLSKITDFLLESLKNFSSSNWLSTLITLFDLVSTTTNITSASVIARTRVLMIRSIVSSISAVVKYLPAFIHPHLYRIFSLLFTLGQPLEGMSANDSELIVGDVDNCLHVICEKVSGRLLVPVLQSSAPDLLSKSPFIASNFTSFIKLYVGGLDRSQITHFLSSLCSLLTMSFDYRRAKRLTSDSEDKRDQGAALVSAYERYNVDEMAVEGAVELCLKLTEPELNLYLSRLGEWKDVEFESLDGNWRHVSRRKVYYAFLANLSSKLSTLFIPFMESNWANAIESLQEFIDFNSFYASLSRSSLRSSMSSSKKDKKRKHTSEGGSDSAAAAEFKGMLFDDPQSFETSLMVSEIVSTSSHILDTIRVCCIGDTGNAIDVTRYESLIVVLASCLSARDVFASDADFFHHCNEHVINTIAAFSKSIQKDVIWKPMNHRILLCTRNKSSSVKIAAIITLRRLFEEVGDEYLLLLPECLPYLSELLEDDDTAVVAETAKTIKAIEELSGEELDAYLQ